MPPPAMPPPLPVGEVSSEIMGGFQVGDRVVSRISYSFSSGYVLKDDVGVVKGPSTGRDRGRINVDFPNLRSANMLLGQIRSWQEADIDVAVTADGERPGGVRPGAAAAVAAI